MKKPEGFASALRAAWASVFAPGTNESRAELEQRESIARIIYSDIQTEELRRYTAEVDRLNTWRTVPSPAPMTYTPIDKMSDRERLKREYDQARRAWLEKTGIEDTINNGYISSGVMPTFDDVDSDIGWKDPRRNEIPEYNQLKKTVAERYKSIVRVTAQDIRSTQSVVLPNLCLYCGQRFNDKDRNCDKCGAPLPHRCGYCKELYLGPHCLQCETEQSVTAPKIRY